MKKIGTKIYYDILTGDVIVIIGESYRDRTETTKEQDFECFVELSQRVPETVGLIRLAYGQLREEFMRCSDYRIDITKPIIDHTAIVFNYDQPLPEPQPPTIEEQTLERVQILEEQNLTLMMAQAELYELIVLGGNV